MSGCYSLSSRIEYRALPGVLSGWGQLDACDTTASTILQIIQDFEILEGCLTIDK
jgi:hypothetical protein